MLLVTPAAGVSQITNPAVTLTGRLHAQFNTTTADGAAASEFRVRRARLNASADFGRFLFGRVQADFTDRGRGHLKVALLQLRFSPAFRVSVGQFKRAFDLFELTSSTQTLVIERAGTLRGGFDCGGLGTVCSLSGFSERLQLSSLDQGLLVDGTLSPHVTYLLTLTNGTGQNTADDNSRKSLAARIVVRPGETVRIGVNANWHDYVNVARGGDAYAAAGGVDLEVGDFDGGGHVQAGVVAGRNWRRLDANGDPTTFRTAQVIASYRAPVTVSRRPYAVEPVLRVSWGDPARGPDGDGGWLVTPGLQWHLVGRTKLAVNLDVWMPDRGDRVWSLKVQSSLYFTHPLE